MVDTAGSLSTNRQ